jgi:hypothetical protein
MELNFLNYNLAWMPLLANTLERYRGRQSALTISLREGLYLDIKMDHYRRPQMPLLWPCIETSTLPL